MKRTLAALLSAMIIFGSICISAAAGNMVIVSNEEEFINAVNEASEGTDICLKGGTYRFDSPIVFDGLKKNIKISSVSGETAVLTNACPVTQWSECSVNGINALCASAGGKRISALFSDEGKLNVSRLPETGYWHIDRPDLSDTKGEGNDLASNGFYIKDLEKSPANLKDVTVEILHQWVSEVDRPVSFDPNTGLMKISRYTGRPLESGDRYFLENIMEGMDKPGEWCFDSSADKIYYIPFEGETAGNLTLYASAGAQLMSIANSSGIAFENIRFADTGWEHSNDGYLNMNIHTRLRDYQTSSVQGAVDVPGAIDVTYSDSISFTNCDFENIGVHAIRLFTGAKNCTVDSCYFNNIGASAVFAGGKFYFGDNAANNSDDYAENITVRNCEIMNYGRQFCGACGIIVTYCDGADISHNEIHDGYYTGISAGFTWLFLDNPTQNINICDNLIYNIGLDTLSDLGGIYMLGVQEGTVVSGNVIHDCSCYSGEGGYAGDGIYLDSGCEFMTVENNLVFNCSTSAFNTTLSKNNTIRNNIFALSGKSIACLGEEEYAAFTDLNNAYVNNIFLTDSKVVAIEHINHAGHFNGSGNILWDMTCGDELYFTIGSHTDNAIIRQDAEERGLLNSAMYLDPGFVNASSYDFSFSGDSAAVKLGFEPFDYTEAGTVKNTTIGISRAGGQTSYNRNTGKYDSRTASISFGEKIKLFFNGIIDKIKNLFGIKTKHSDMIISDVYTTDYQAKEKNGYAAELTELIDEVKKHTPSYRVDESRKPFADDERIKAIYFDGEKCNGRDAEVFAYIGFPENASAANPVPAVVLVHGGGVHAQADWVQYWVDRGYAAISFDGFGQQPKAGYYSAAGGNNPDWTVNPDSHLPFSNLDDVDEEFTNQWFYFYLADIVLSNNILRADSRVVSNQIGVSGISWGSLITTVAACYDERFAFAIPIYGSGCWDHFNGFFTNPLIFEKWDPTPMLKDVEMPIMFVSSEEDPFFQAFGPSDSAALAKHGSVLFINGLMHGEIHIEETVRFANEVTGVNDVNIRITGISEENGKVTISFDTPSNIKSPAVILYYRTVPLEYDGITLKEHWSSKKGTVKGNTATVTVPDGAIMYYVAVEGKCGSAFSHDAITASTGIFCK